MEERIAHHLLIKNFCYTIFIIICYILENVPHLLSFMGVTPLITLLAVVSIAIIEGEFSGALFGLFAGMLIDIGAFHIFGLATFTFMLIGCIVGLIIICLMQNNLRTMLILSSGSVSVYLLVCHYVLYGMWDYEGSTALIITKVIPTVMLSSVWAIFIFWICNKIHKKLTLE